MVRTTTRVINAFPRAYRGRMFKYGLFWPLVVLVTAGGVIVFALGVVGDLQTAKSIWDFFTGWLSK